MTVINDKKPINNNYTATSLETGTDYSRLATGGTTAQSNDIIRVGDIIGWTGQTAGEESYVMVSKVTYDNGIDFVSDIQSKGTSSAASYITKEVSVQNPATGIDVRLTANTVAVSYTNLTLPTTPYV